MLSRPSNITERKHSHAVPGGLTDCDVCRSGTLTAEMPYVIENLRLGELVGIVNANERFYDDFVDYLKAKGFDSVQSFVAEPSDEKAIAMFLEYLQRGSKVTLYDGLGRPYEDRGKARWCFLAWLFRDAPSQRLQPLLRSMPGSTVHHRRAYLLNVLRKYVHPLFPRKESWSWPVISEIMLARLEGSRRALKGTLFEAIIRSSLHELFESEGIYLKIGDKEVKLNDESYDVQVVGSRGKVLMPVKTRETMGGGHALLFTRDIHKSISVAHDAGFQCIPIVIAESWGGDLDSLNCAHYIYLQANPNQVQQITPLLNEKLKALVPVFEALQ